MNELKYFTIVFVTAIVALCVIVISYWYIMKQDATVLTIASSAIGGLVGYFFKMLKDRISEQG